MLGFLHNFKQCLSCAATSKKIFEYFLFLDWISSRVYKSFQTPNCDWQHRRKKPGVQLQFSGWTRTGQSPMIYGASSKKTLETFLIFAWRSKGLQTLGMTEWNTKEVLRIMSINKAVSKISGIKMHWKHRFP